MKGMKKAISAILTVLTTAALAATVYAADYGTPPSVAVPATSSSSAAADRAGDAVKAVVSDGKVAAEAVAVKSTNVLPVSSSVIKALQESETAVLTISAPKAKISIDAATITKVTKVDLSAKIYSSEKRAVVDFRSNKKFGCDVKVTLTNCKMSAELLAKAHVYCDGEDLGAVELNDAGQPVITVTKGGKYEIKVA